MAVHSARLDISDGGAGEWLARLETSATGLTTNTAQARLTEYGPNDPAAEKASAARAPVPGPVP